MIKNKLVVGMMATKKNSNKIYLKNNLNIYKKENLHDYKHFARTHILEKIKFKWDFIHGNEKTLKTWNKLVT